jgi:hypothetical protein
MSDQFVVVVEGCDKTGKTSLVAALHEALGWPMVKSSQTTGPDAALQEYLDVLDHEKGHFIADRFHVGESVYGPIYRGTLPLDHTAMRLVEERLLDRGCLLVLMEDDPEAVIARFKALKEDFAREQDVRDIIAKFDVEWRRSRLAKIRARWDPFIPPPHGVTGTVVDVVYAMGAKR